MDIPAIPLPGRHSFRKADIHETRRCRIFKAGYNRLGGICRAGLYTNFVNKQVLSIFSMSNNRLGRITMSPTIIRPAKESDAAELARLTSQLGYPVSEASIRTRMCRMFGSVDVSLLVAERPNGKLAGWIHGFLCQLLESDYRVEIGGLIVDEQCRRSGIGRELVLAIENWATEHGATELSVRCREEARSRTSFMRLYRSGPSRRSECFVNASPMPA